MPIWTDSAGACPHCGAYTERTSMPLALRWVRVVFHDASFRRCFCGWRGLRLNRASVAAQQARRSA